jgi:hypothetical protein
LFESLFEDMLCLIGFAAKKKRGLLNAAYDASKPALALLGFVPNMNDPSKFVATLTFINTRQ